ncbi:MAG TPA: MltR family transcriptional regulator [Symbiobacteriaceae bacterium]|nr:MltR family transcriptional regulator [Symbiobacteriaceae bacterium]
MKKPPEVEQLAAEVQKMFDVLNDESDVGCVVVGAAFLDAELGALLSLKLIDSPESDQLLGGALGNFSTRAQVAYCLRLIRRDQYQDLKEIAKIRNQFAHSHLLLSFADPSIRESCDRLNQWRTILHGENEAVPASVSEEWRTRRARNQFNLSVVFGANWLLMEAMSAKMGR